MSRQTIPPLEGAPRRPSLPHDALAYAHAVERGSAKDGRCPRGEEGDTMKQSTSTAVKVEMSFQGHG